MKIDELMNRYYGKLNENDKWICSYIMNHRSSCYKLSIEAFAQECNVSTATLFRFAQKLSLGGFGELKARLRLEAEHRADKSADTLEHVTDSYHKMIDMIQKRDCSRIFEKMYRSDRIILYGSGYVQARVAREFKRIFLPTRKIMYDIHGHDVAGSVMNLAQEHDFVILISLSGESESVVALAERLRLCGVETMSITKMKNNSLASWCGENLYIHTIELPGQDDLGYEISTPYFILIELLFLKYQEYLGTL